MLLAQISDLHLDGSARAAERVARTMDHLRALPQPVDALLVTGDIADHGSPAEYEEAARLLAAPFPVLTCPGNHDERSAYLRVLLGRAGRQDGQAPPGQAQFGAGDEVGPLNQAYHVDGATILMCDSTIPGHDDGLLTTETLDWIGTTLDELPYQTPALLAFHHPPVPLHHPLPDSIRLRNPDELAEVLTASPQVVAVLAGHAHTAAVSSFGGKLLLVGPAVTWTLRLPWEGEEPADREQPPALAFHVLDEDGRLTTHFRAVL